MTEKERVTVDLDEECYYLDGEFWTSWDHYGEQMADEINKLLNEQEETIQEYKHLVKIATGLIEWNTIPQIRREWEKHLSKVGDVE